MRLRTVIVTFVAVAFVVSACGSSKPTSRSPSSTTSRNTAPANFSGRGPYAVGVTRMHLSGGRQVEVFYPVDRKALPADATAYAYTPKEVWGPLLSAFPPGLVYTTNVPDAWVNAPASAGGPFPVAIFSHGWGSTRLFYSLHNAHLASWGFVVAAPEHVSRDLQARLLRGQTTLPPSDAVTIRDTLALMTGENVRAGSVLQGRVAIDKVAVEGHSAGGRDAALAARLPAVDTWIDLAGVPPVPNDAIAPGTSLSLRIRSGFDLAGYLAKTPPPDRPSMTIMAENDIIIPPSTDRPIYSSLPTPKRWVVLANTGHVVFQDACADIQEQGGLQALAAALHVGRSSLVIREAENGCLPKDATATKVTAVWNHLTVAQLNWVFGIDRDAAAASLEQSYLDRTFPGMIKEYLVD
jgi:pimeloyl-ACP methyl ester carboxylesterase